MMTSNDPLRNAGADLLAAFGLLTRLPIPMIPGPMRGASTVWAWPLVGAAVGAFAATVAYAALAFGATAGTAAALILAAQVMLTGAMHEDGLADSADGLWGGWDKARRLAIMKDSHIGSYGVIALVLVGLLRWSALSVICEQGGIWALVAVGAISRVPMALLMALLPNARSGGLSQSVGRPSAEGALLALGLGLAIGVVFLAGDGVWLAVWAALPCLALARLARAKIGGQTGDILGASQQLAEAAGLAYLASMMGA